MVLDYQRERGSRAEDQGGDAARRAVIIQHLALHGPLDEVQRLRLAEIAQRCPLHRLLWEGVRIEQLTVTADNGQ